MRKSKHAKRKIALSKSSPFSGVQFPEGSKRVAFTAYCDAGGNIRATRRAIQDAGERAPSVKTLTHWAEENSWEVLRMMVDDGILEYLDAQDDPDIKEAIKDDAGLFKFLIRLRSTLYAKLSAKQSVLMPQNTSDLVKLLKHVSDVIDPIKSRMEEAENRRGISIPVGDEGEGDSETVQVPLNVMSIARRLEEKGEPVTESNMAREILSLKEQQQES